MAATLAAGCAGGLALASFATGGASAASASTGDPYTATYDDADGNAATDVTAPPVADDAPEHYVCTGCGPSLAEREARRYTAGYGDDEPRPAYRPLPFEDDAAPVVPDHGDGQGDGALTDTRRW